jgi:hypothetical protein
MVHGEYPSGHRRSRAVVCLEFPVGDHQEAFYLCKLGQRGVFWEMSCWDVRAGSECCTPAPLTFPYLSLEGLGAESDAPRIVTSVIKNMGFEIHKLKLR